jgi:hypothetical protein
LKARDDAEPSYSPSGKRIAYTRATTEPTGEWEIYTKNAGGRGMPRLIHPTSWNRNSPKFIYEILHNPTLILQESSLQASCIAPARQSL